MLKSSQEEESLVTDASKLEPARPNASSGRPRNRRGQGSLLRGDILDAAQRLLEREGGEGGVTIRAVTREAGIAPQSFYLQFASTSELLFAIYDRGHDELREALKSSLDATNHALPAERLLALCAAYLRFSRDNAGLYRTLMGTAGEIHADWDPERLPGAGTFALLSASVAEVRRDLADTPRALFTYSVLLWTQLHGIASLTLDRPTFPWPPDATMLDAVVIGIDDAGDQHRR